MIRAKVEKKILFLAWQSIASRHFGKTKVFGRHFMNG